MLMIQIDWQTSTLLRTASRNMNTIVLKRSNYLALIYMTCVTDFPVIYATIGQVDS